MQKLKIKQLKFIYTKEYSLIFQKFIFIDKFLEILYKSDIYFFCTNY